MVRMSALETRSDTLELEVIRGVGTSTRIAVHAQNMLVFDFRGDATLHIPPLRQEAYRHVYSFMLSGNIIARPFA